MKYKLIACDLDETLLNSDHKVAQRNIELIHKARALGVKFVPATGRLFTSVGDVLKELGLEDQQGEYVLSANGAIITENKNHEIIQMHGLTFEKMKEIFDFGTQQDVCIHIHTLENVYIYNFNEDERLRCLKQGLQFEVLDSHNIELIRNDHIVKVLFQSLDMPYLQSLEDKMTSIVENQISISYSSDRYMELNQLGVSKGQGLRDLAKLLNIPIEATIAVGDHYNDESMLKAAGLSVAAANAIEDIQNICDYTTKANHNEGVVAELIEKFILSS